MLKNTTIHISFQYQTINKIYETTQNRIKITRISENMNSTDSKILKFKRK